MKKLILILGFLVLCGRAWALPDNVISQEYGADTEIKSSGGYVYNVQISFTGGAAGDEAWMWDATTPQTYAQGLVSGSGTARCHVVSSGANTNYVCGPYTSSNYFTTAIYFGYRSSGRVVADIQWQ